MTIEIIEYILISVIIFLQIREFSRTRKQINIFKNIIPNIELIYILKVELLTTDLERFSPQVILENVGRIQRKTQKDPNIYIQIDDKDRTNPYHSEDSLNGFVASNSDDENILPKVSLNILAYKGAPNAILNTILFSINKYLIRNRSSSADFILIKDIIERNVNTVEEDINLTISIPLYIGLVGTMLGIVIGLFNMPNMSISTNFQANDALLNEGIASLIGGVRIAMIASFTGLILTIINSGRNFKGSRSLVEARKNEFYTFIQVELLPIMNQGLASTFESLQRNLMKFNGEFTTNLAKLGGIFDSSYSTVIAQKELLDSLNKAKVSEMMQYNVKVLKQLEVSFKEFETFNSSMMDVNTFVTNSSLIVERTNELLNRTDNFKLIAENLEDKFNESQKLMEFLSSHFNSLEKHKEFTSNAVADVGHAISSSFKDLQEHIQNSSSSIKQFTVDEIEILKKVFSESKTNLVNLQHLGTINNNFSNFKDNTASQNEKIRQRLEEINKNIEISTRILETAERNKKYSTTKKVATYIKHFFGSEK